MKIWAKELNSRINYKIIKFVFAQALLVNAKNNSKMYIAFCKIYEISEKVKNLQEEIWNDFEKIFFSSKKLSNIF